MDPAVILKEYKRRTGRDLIVMKVDRLSKLSDALLLDILSLVPSIYAVRTCVLSKRWRSLWKYVPTLDYHCIKNDTTDLPRLSSKFVNRFLLLNKSQLLESMRLVVGFSCEAVDIRIWIEHAVECGLRKLELDYLSGKRYIQLPNAIYACKTLEVLKLKKFVYVDVPEFFTCFKYLKVMNLNLVAYKDDDSVRSLFSSCTNLEDLVLERFSDNVIKFTIEVPSLKRLSIRDYSNGNGIRGYVINAPSLNYLSIEGLRNHEFSLKDTPTLIEAKIIDVNHMNSKKILLPLASSVKRLTVSLSHIEIEFATSMTFHKLLYLELYASKAKWCDLLMIFLLSSPKLQALKLKDGYGVLSISDFKKPIDAPYCLLFNLEIFEWERYNGLKEEERQLATYILTNAKHLKEAKFSTIHVTSEVKLEMLKELALVPRASRSCQLFFECKKKNIVL